MYSETNTAPAASRGHGLRPVFNSSANDPGAKNGSNLAEVVVDIDYMKTRVLSGDGEIAANAEQRKLLCYVADGRLFVATGKRLDHQVQSYCANLNRRQKKYNIQEVSMSVITKLYASCSGSATRQSDTSRMIEEGKLLIQQAASRRASDIHIRVGAHTEIYYRIHGDLTKISEDNSTYGMRLIRTFYQAMADISDDTFKEQSRLDARIASREKLPENIHGVRISTTPMDEGNLMVLRLLYNDTDDSIDLRHLGFSEMHYELMRLMNEQPIGMNIICGPTGSGKSTTLQRVLRWQISECKGTRHVITVEDPPEYPIEGAVQTPVANAEDEKTRSQFFSEAISSAMRLDPDTIMIGEMRNPSSAQMALRAAMTGHQVWSTLHANSAMAIIDRLVDLGLPLDLLTDHTLVTGLIAQRLVKVLCPHCKKRLIEHENNISHSLFERLKRALGADWVNVYIVGDGCHHCRGYGYSGRTVVCEVIIPDPKFMAYIRKGDKIAAREHWLQNQRGTTYLHHAIEKIRKGEIDPVNAERIVGRLNMDELLSDSSLTMQEIANGGTEN